MSHDSPLDLLVLHAVRIIGFADIATIAHRFDLDAAETEELLRDAEAHGWTTYTAFGHTAGWSLTERGRAENERRLASELTEVGGAEHVWDVYREFLPLNALLLRACTDWQLRPDSCHRVWFELHEDLIATLGIDRRTQS